MLHQKSRQVLGGLASPATVPDPTIAIPKPRPRRGVKIHTASSAMSSAKKGQHMGGKENVADRKMITSNAMAILRPTSFLHRTIPIVSRSCFSFERRLDLRSYSSRPQEIPQKPRQQHPTSLAASATMPLHHLMIGTWTPPGAIFTVQFDDENLTLKLVKRTEIPQDEPISWMTFDVRPQPQLAIQ